jgi:hypothetical protein
MLSHIESFISMNLDPKNHSKILISEAILITKFKIIETTKSLQEKSTEIKQEKNSIADQLNLIVSEVLENIDYRTQQIQEISKSERFGHKIDNFIQDLGNFQVKLDKKHLIYHSIKNHFGSDDNTYEINLIRNELKDISANLKKGNTILDRVLENSSCKNQEIESRLDKIQKEIEDIKEKIIKVENANFIKHSQTHLKSFAGLDVRISSLDYNLDSLKTKFEYCNSFTESLSHTIKHFNPLNRRDIKKINDKNYIFLCKR